MRARLLIAIASLLFALSVKAEQFPSFPTSEKLIDLLYSDDDVEILKTEVINDRATSTTTVTVIKSPKYGLVTCFQNRIGAMRTECVSGATQDQLDAMDEALESYLKKNGIE